MPRCCHSSSVCRAIGVGKPLRLEPARRMVGSRSSEGCATSPARGGFLDCSELHSQRPFSDSHSSSSCPSFRKGCSRLAQLDSEPCCPLWESERLSGHWQWARSL